MALKEPVGLKIAKAQGIALGKIRKEMQPEGLQEGIMAQSLANILIHIIFNTKNRQPMILPEIIKELYSYMAGIARAHESKVPRNWRNRRSCTSSCFFAKNANFKQAIAAFQAAFFF